MLIVAYSPVARFLESAPFPISIEPKLLYIKLVQMGAR